jgi:hypothetical protein
MILRNIIAFQKRIHNDLTRFLKVISEKFEKTDKQITNLTFNKLKHVSSLDLLLLNIG